LLLTDLSSSLFWLFSKKKTGTKISLSHYFFFRKNEKKTKKTNKQKSYSLSLPPVCTVKSKKKIKNRNYKSTAPEMKGTFFFLLLKRWDFPPGRNLEVKNPPFLSFSLAAIS